MEFRAHDNGRLLLDLIERENLILANSSPLCKGAITRHRVSQKNVEKSILDYILVCEKLGQFLDFMEIDEKRDFPLTKYASKKGNRKIVKSDHNTLYGRFSIQYRNLSWKKPRKEMFNLKNIECQQRFTEVTNKSNKLKKCFSSNLKFEDQCNHFFKTFEDILHQCFKKVRIGTNKNKKSEIQELLDLQSHLKSSQTTNPCPEKLEEIEKQIIKTLF